MFIEGEKVYIRSQKRNDIPNIVRWKNDLEIAELVRGSAIYTNEGIETRRYEKSMEEFDTIRLIIETKTGEVIGLITLGEIDKPNQKAEIGMLIGEKEYWNKGYGTDTLFTLLNYLFNELDFNRISLEVFDFNARAKRLYEKIGFAVEGLQREGLIQENRKCDIYLMGILKKDFLAKNSLK